MQRDIARYDTFKSHGVSKQAVEDYLKTSEGKLYRQRLIEADPVTARNDPNKIIERAVEQITSGIDLPRLETINH